ncbi:hypothetical protein GQ53DRAFT_292784 [Thozetella sp. PMI_491]|nr:hypothetical protein GQ53DRAFT_292784 [Thozetella sp. PMI_491]
MTGGQPTRLARNRLHAYISICTLFFFGPRQGEKEGMGGRPPYGPVRGVVVVLVLSSTWLAFVNCPSLSIWPICPHLAHLCTWCRCMRLKARPANRLESELDPNCLHHQHSMLACGIGPAWSEAILEIDAALPGPRPGILDYARPYKLFVQIRVPVPVPVPGVVLRQRLAPTRSRGETSDGRGLSRTGARGAAAIRRHRPSPEPAGTAPTGWSAPQAPPSRTWYHFRGVFCKPFMSLFCLFSSLPFCFSFEAGHRQSVAVCSYLQPRPCARAGRRSYYQFPSIPAWSATRACHCICSHWTLAHEAITPQQVLRRCGTYSVVRRPGPITSVSHMYCPSKVGSMCGVSETA